MPFLLAFVGVILIVTAYQNTMGQLATELETDVPPFAKWAAAIVAVGALGWVPGMQTISRYLLGLVLLVIVLSNWTKIQSGIQGLTSLSTAATTGTTTPTTPAQAYVSNPTNPNITTADITGTTGTGTTLVAVQNVPGSINAASQTVYTSSPLGAYDPAAFLTAYESGLGGFGGVV